MNQPSAEATLVGQAKAGSTRAFSELVVTEQQAVRAFLRRLCGDWAEADDLAQEAFVAAWEGMTRFQADRSLRAWLCGIAYRKYLASRRALFRRRKREAEYYGEQPATVPPASDARLDVSKALAGLPPEQRAAVALCLAAEFSHQEAAEALGIPLGTVKSHVARGRAKLLIALGGENE